MGEIGSKAQLRVILVGNTDLDGELRREPEVELLRARTALDALGELSDPLDDESPDRTVVVVAPSAEPEGADRGDLEEFVDGLRRIEPEVWVLRLQRGEAEAPAPYDGTIEPGDALATLLAIVGATATSGSGDAARPITNPPDPLDGPFEEPIDEQPIESGDAARDESGEHEDRSDEVVSIAAAEAVSPSPVPPSPAAPPDDTPLVRALLTGDDLLEHGLDLIRHRSGSDSVVFIAREDDNDTAWSRWSSASVPGESGPHGELRSPDVDIDDLAGHAAWLGTWLDLEAHHDALLEAAYTDPLTGAHNRRYFDEFLPDALDSARADRRSLTLLLFDIDDFKRFNDDHGHAAGDEILVDCVRMLEAVVRPTDKVCRIGGDEFAVIFDEPEGPRERASQHPASVYEIAERFRAQCRSARFPRLGDDAPGHLTISGGLATFPWDGMTAEDLVARADELALEGKRQGKNVIAIGPGTREG